VPSDTGCLTIAQAYLASNRTAPIPDEKRIFVMAITALTQRSH
jgi:hypothetical protein